jgi:arylsulfatase A
METTAMNNAKYLHGALAIAAAISSLIHAAEARRPNVIVILTDDQGTIDANCYGARDLVTPAIDALAERGVRFTQFYAAAPVCSPSRAGLITGRYPIRAGVPNNVSSQQGHAGMAAEQVTLGDMFQAAGYATAHIGKWHLGYTPETMPNNQGFDHSFGHMGGCIDNYSHFFYWQGPNRHDLWRNGVQVFHDGRYFPDLMVDETVEFIQQPRDKPFFIYFAINLPHYPYQGDAHWLEYYHQLPYPRNLYAAFLSAMDARILRLLQALDRLELREQTILVFQSDHGHSCEERAHFGGGNAGPYRGAKFSLFEGGIRVPAIISWPGSLPENVVRDQMAHSCDWLPTLAELCDVPLLDQEVDGKSLVPVIQSEAAPSPHEVLHWTTGKSWAVRRGDWKLLGEPSDTSNKGKLAASDKRFLVNLAEDITEMKNLAAENPQVVQQLEKLHEDWFEQASSTATEPPP